MADSKDYDWSNFTIKQVVNASNKKIEACFTTQSGLEAWFLRLAEFKNPGGIKRKQNESIEAFDTYKWMWHGYPDSVSETGEILTPAPDEIIRFKFGQAGIVAVRIIEQENVKLIELRQSQIPASEQAKVAWHLGCKTGWTFYLLNLKSILEGGLDLRNKNNNLRLD